MSNFHIFKDPITADTQPASNLLPDLPPNPLPEYLCFCCLHEKANTEFLPDALLLATPTPLAMLEGHDRHKLNRRDLVLWYVVPILGKFC